MYPHFWLCHQYCSQTSRVVYVARSTASWKTPEKSDVGQKPKAANRGRPLHYLAFGVDYRLRRRRNDNTASSATTQAERLVDFGTEQLHPP
jgi:hypothetical protein